MNKKKKFAIVVLDPKYEVFIVYIATFNISSNKNNEVHFLKNTQIAYLKVDKVSIKIFSK